MTRNNLLVLLFFIAFSSLSHGFFDPTAGRWISRDPIGERGGINLNAFVENRPTQSIDHLGLAVTSVGGNLSTTDGDAANCSVTVYFGHGNTGALLRSRPGTIDEQLEKDLKLGNECNRSAYVGCGANRINTIADVSGIGVPGVPLNDEPFPPGGQRPGIELDTDCLHEDSVLGRIGGALEAALVQAASMATNRSPCCCRCVRVRVVCLDDILDQVIKSLEIVEGGNQKEVNQFKAMCDFNISICAP